MEKTQGGTALPPAPLPDVRRKPGRPAHWSGCQVCGVDVSSYRSFHQVRMLAVWGTRWGVSWNLGRALPGWGKL